MKKILLALLTVPVLMTSCGKAKEVEPQPVTINHSANLITDWIGMQLQVIRNTSGVTHVAYSRHFAYTGVALYEALVLGDKRYQSVASQLNGLTDLPVPPAGKPIFWPAAANATIAEMLRYFYPAKAANLASIDSLENAYKERYAAELAPAFDMDTAISFGKAIASVIIEWSKKDEAVNANIPYLVQAAGYWEPTAPAYAAAAVPAWGLNKPILASSDLNAMPPSPISFSPEVNTPFYNMAKEVYDVSKSLTQEQKDIALFWDDSPNGKYFTVFGHWFSILRQVLIAENRKLMEGAEAYLRLGITVNDVSISCWKAKYSYHQMRPITYIRKYLGHSDWNSLISTPPHPEYSAAHATLSSAAAYALASVFGKNYSFTDHSYDDLGMQSRTYPDFETAGVEAGMSRLYGGIHYKASINAGNTQGQKVGQNVESHLKTLRLISPR